MTHTAGPWTFDPAGPRWLRVADDALVALVQSTPQGWRWTVALYGSDLGGGTTPTRESAQKFADLWLGVQGFTLEGT